MIRKHHLLIAAWILFLFTSGCREESTRATTPPATPALPPGPSLQGDSWIRTFDGGHVSGAGDVIQTRDGGFLIGGGMGGLGGGDQQGGVLLIKTDGDGEIVWQQVYGGEQYDAGWSLAESADGGYLVAGETASFGAGGMDGYMIKVDPDGREIWSHTYGSMLNEVFSSIAASADGGYYLIGNVVDPHDVIADPGKAGYAGFAGRSSIYVVKTDAEGNETWSRVFDSGQNVLAAAGTAARDGGVIILATVMYYPDFDNDILLLKIDEEGEEIWTRTWQEAGLAGYAMARTSDDCILITGIYETSADKPSELYLLKVDAEGNQIWMAVQGDPGLYESGQSVIETVDGSYLVLVSTTASLYAGSSGVELAQFAENGDFLYLKPLATRHKIKAQMILQSTGGGYVITGSIVDDSADTYQAVLIKTDADGHVQEQEAP